MAKIDKFLAKAREHIHLGRVAEAERYSEKALALESGNSDGMLLLGKVRYNQKRFREACELLRKVVQARPMDSEARIYLFSSLKDGKFFAEMVELAREFLEQPAGPGEELAVYTAFLDVCDWQAAERLQPHVLDLVLGGEIGEELLPSLLLSLNCVPGISHEDIHQAHRVWAEKVARANHSPLCKQPPERIDGRIKIGYLSADFNMHPVGKFMEGIIALHDRQRFEVFCYAHQLKEDERSRMFREHADHYIDVTQMTFEETAKRIHQDGIDVLVDLGGHTAFSRLRTMLFRPAPVQIAYLGYPNTTGLAEVDFRISDPYADIEQGTQYSEQLLCMPQSFLCLSGLTDLPRAEQTPAARNGYVTFGSFNHVRKLNPRVIALWSRILKRVDASRLLIKSPGCDAPIICDNILAEFGRHGIDAERIAFAAYSPSYAEHVASYSEVDIALDSFPYNGTTTTCETLWMGVPLLTLVGEAHAQRTSYSILKNIGMESLALFSEEDYVAKAVELAGLPENLTFLRQCLPTLIKHSILCQPHEFTGQLEALYVEACERKGIAVSDQSQTVQAQSRGLSAAERQRLQLAEFLRPRIDLPRIQIAEIGARLVDGEGEAFHHLPEATVIAFEPDAESCEALAARPSAAEIRVFPYALSAETGKQTLYLTRHGMCSSLYPPDEALLRRYAGLEVAYLKDHRKVDVISLADFMRRESVAQLDFMKIDVQGAELDVFAGAGDALAGLLGICTEVSWMPLYKGQPLFGDIDTYLRGQGFQLHHFLGFGGRPIQGMPFGQVQQAMWSDAVYFPSLPVVDTLPPERLLKLAVLAGLYDAVDLAHYALLRYDAERGTHYFNELTGQSSEPQRTSAAAPDTDAQLVLQMAGDIEVVVPNDMSLMTPYVLQEQRDWFEDEIKFIRRLIRPGSQAIDIGANYGCYALTIGKLLGEAGRLWAFEPASSTAGFLQRSVERNRLGNIEIMRTAVSDHAGEARLSIGDNAELNAIVDGSGEGRFETVPLVRMDDCIDHCGWQEIEFVKLDAEGQELNILEGGRHFFAHFSPLVMFELKHGDEVNEGLIQRFRDFGYAIYALVPGLMLLKPFDEQDTFDPFQLNLFACKPDRAATLAAAGLLAQADDTGEQAVVEAGWDLYLSRFAYAQQLFPSWREKVAGGRHEPGWEGYAAALDAFAQAHDPAQSPARRLQLLQRSFLALTELFDVHVTVPRLMSLVRVAAELGQRGVAVHVLNEIARHFEQHPNFHPEEPFLAVSERASLIDPGDNIGEWALGQVLAERERLQAFSSYFTGENSLPGLEMIENIGYPDEEMRRRSELVRNRFALA